ncbi:lysophospholipid acyltransferase family protein [Acetobacter orleanensis]|uniref:1-acyl-sn-glycerol-3-phosphate acyltransferase n=1 Tax=Acetobacter orleanensis TaxID=104099 RepID=A0A4Y3TFQ1_9PROT|nr:lysophospholipid acyltransferase family protein [Acetobacter orleanensis]KXV62052.1 acyl-phosphate glycerol 3-phosphate acyltransferase [Acetobacter orleanensis]GAN68518.1 1-acyl-sn-glycerol-3-phosphate acyltransferase [Acetobacter orleanensis JCM 7639]GEB81741.1 1-acyl-sn-glycerol-3-phosphate acyltransferase [Acetobacter orleanensis]
MSRAFLSPLPSWVEKCCRLRAQAKGGLRLGTIALWVPLSVGFEACLLLVPGTPKIRWTRVIWGVLCKLLGLRIRVIGKRAGNVGGARARARGERPVIYISNHSSWLDVLVLGTLLPSVFVAKGDIEKWPIMGLVSKIGRTIFVSRQRSTTGRERDLMIRRMVEGDNLVLFPEGTSSDGSRVLPFMSAFFAIAKLPRLRDGEKSQIPLVYDPGMSPIIQPISVVYDELEGLPVARLRRPVFAWYGDMDLGPHLWQLVQWQRARATVILHEPLDPELFPSRKALAQAAWHAVAQGAADLRQNQDAQPQSGRCEPDQIPSNKSRFIKRLLDRLPLRFASYEKTS